MEPRGTSEESFTIQRRRLTRKRTSRRFSCRHGISGTSRQTRGTRYSNS